MLREIDGIEEITMTTNGCLLAEHMDDLVASGLDGINISIDSMDPDRYHQITRVGNLEDALEGLEAAIKSGIKVKVNTVLCPGDDWKQMVEIARDNPVDVRFIETMPLGLAEKYAGACKGDILEYFREHGISLEEVEESRGNGPAVYYKPEGFMGNIGIIAPLHGKFCERCNRIRLSARGEVRPCLCYGQTLDVKECLRQGQPEDVGRILEEAIQGKPAAHRLEEAAGDAEMFRIGG
ncbi:MAG: radical SAM protein, partial [Eubacterium sp.]|nr:radical SAM protein [Candidatus Colimonas fimequi]